MNLNNDKLHKNSKWVNSFLNKIKIIKTPSHHIMTSPNHQQNIIIKTHHHLHMLKKLNHHLHRLIVNKQCSKGNKSINNLHMLMGNWLKKLRKNQYLKFFHHHLRHQIIYLQNHKFSVQIHQNHKSKTTSHSPHHQQQHQQISFSQLNKSEYPHHHQIET